MGFNEIMLKKQIKDLSLGERTRIKIANMILEESNLLILDEPNNHLDLYSREQLEDTLKDYNGTLLIVSHDSYMLEKLCDKLLIFEDGIIQKFEGGFKEYIKRQSNESKKRRDKSINIEEEKIVIENRIAFIAGKLSQFTQEDLEYKQLEEEFISLIKRKKNL